MTKKVPEKDVCVVCHPPEHLTQPGWRFSSVVNELVFFIGFVADLVGNRDRVLKASADAFEVIRHEGIDDERIASMGDGPTKKALLHKKRLIHELMRCRVVDNYLTYIAEMLAKIFRTKPATMKSAETVRLDRVLAHATMQSLIDDIADQQVHKLSYQSLDDLAEYMSSRLRLDLFDHPETQQRAVLIVAKRNLIVHARGIINERFLNTHPEQGALGQPVDVSDVFEEMFFLSRCVFAFDESVAAKYGIERSQARMEKQNGNAHD